MTCLPSLVVQEAKLEKNVSGLSARLGNDKFVSSAPDKVVNEVREQLAEADEQLTMVRDKIEQVHHQHAS